MPAPSERPGAGATLYPGGVTFRVWAPHASAVHVAGEFNGWDDAATSLARDPDGRHWSADVPGASVGQRYRFVVDGDRRFDPRARHVTHSAGESIVTDPQHTWQVDDFGMPPWNELVVYEMHVATFPDDPVEPAGLFDSIIGDMGYLRDLGVNAIEILPAKEFPGDDSWGYNPAHVFAVESSYGGPHAFQRFVDEAHRHGIAVIVDVVFNHFGPDDLAVWQLDGWFQRWNGDDMGGIYFYNDWRAHTPWGHKNRPDYGRPEVRQFIRDNSLMWLEDYRADGLRFDATSFIRTVYGRTVPPGDPQDLGGWGWNLLRWINDEVDHRQPWKITIAEDMQGDSWITRRTPAGGAGFDAQWDADFHHSVRGVLVAARDEDRSMDAVRRAIERTDSGDAFRRVIYTESHDEVAAANGKRRLPDDIHPGNADGWHAKKRSTLGAALALTSPGIPMLFQGQEILEWIPFGDQNRIDWDKYDQFRGIFHLYRDLVRLRRNWFDHTRGLRGHHANVFWVGHGDKVVAFHRWDRGGPGDDVVVVLSFANRGYPSYTIGFPRPGLWRVRFNSDWGGYSPDFGNHSSDDTTAHDGPLHGMPCHGDVGLGPYSAIILSQ